MAAEDAAGGPDGAAPPASGSPPARPGLWRLAATWLGLGLQSFGGGSATMALIRRCAVDEQRWLSEAEFARDWAISQVAPGINLLCLTVLLGWRVRGLSGACVALLGLAAPSGLITIALTLMYASIRDSALVHAALAGIIPATIGLGLVMTWQMARPAVGASRAHGGAALVLALLVLAGSAVLVGAFRVPVLAVLLGGGAALGLAEWWRARRGRQR